MEDAAIIALYWQRDQQAITASDQKYGKLCHSLSCHILQRDGPAVAPADVAFNSMSSYRHIDKWKLAIIVEPLIQSTGSALMNPSYSLHVNLKYLLASICPPLSKQITALGLSWVTVNVSNSLPSVS